MRILISLLLTCLFAGCSAVGPLPGHFTQNLSQNQMTVVLDRHLKAGMPLEEVQAFLKKEEFTYVHAKESNPGVQALRYTRRDQLDFWEEQFWTVTVETSQGKLVRYTVKSESVKQ
jgi:hypothetical protein